MITPLRHGAWTGIAAIEAIAAIKRIAAIKGIAAIALLCAATPPVLAADIPLTVGKANATSDAITPVNIGDQLGLFKKHGLDLTIVDFGGGARMAQALTA